MVVKEETDAYSISLGHNMTSALHELREHLANIPQALVEIDGRIERPKSLENA